MKKISQKTHIDHTFTTHYQLFRYVNVSLHNRLSNSSQRTNTKRDVGYAKAAECFCTRPILVCYTLHPTLTLSDIFSLFENVFNHRNFCFHLIAQIDTDLESPMNFLSIATLAEVGRTRTAELDHQTYFFKLRTINKNIFINTESFP